jgi:MtrB/PioB family decaheme-associated outer membrane protein
VTARTRLAELLLVLVAAAAPPVAAQPAEEPTFNPTLRALDFGVRVSDVDGDRARFMRFQDFRSGAVLDRGRYTRERDTRWFHFEADNVGYRDQRYSANVDQFGRVKAWFEWNQIPFFYSETARTMFTQTSPGVWRIDDGVQQSIQSGQTTLASAAAALAAPIELRSRRDIADAGVRYQAGRSVDVNLRVVSQRREGNQPFAAGFGMTTPIELVAPIDDRSTDVGANLEWSNRQGLFRVGYDGSWYHNDIETMVWDNPVRTTDLATASSQGRMPLWPSSTTQTFSTTGSLALPRRSRATAHLSRSQWDQDAALLPFTINTTIAPPALERASVEGEAAVTSSLLRFTSRPTNWAWFNASFRSYDFDNRTPVLDVPIQVKYDQALQTATVPETEPLSFTRDMLELEGSFTPWRHGALRLGYTREGVDRTFRFLDETVDHTMRVAYDVTSLDWITLRAAYNRSKRTGAGLDEEAFSDIGEQVSLRQFDIADRVRNQGTLIATLLPSSLFSVNAWIGGGTDDRPDAQFGLTDTSFATCSVGVDAVPRDGVTLGVSYGYETFSSVQNSRQANPPPSPQFTDPTRDWSTDADEKIHTVTVALDVVKGIPNTELRFGYDYNRSRSSYAYGLAPNSTLVTPVQLPAIRNAWQSGTVDVKYRLRRNLAAGLIYRYDHFSVDDFALNPSTIDRLVFGSTMLLGYFYRSYTANTVWLKLTYLW